MTESPAPDLQPIAVARSYTDLRRAIAQWCSHIGMTRAELDVEAGLADGHAGKLLGPKPTKRLGFVTLGRVMAAAGLVLIIAAEPDADVHASEQIATRRPKHWRRHKGSAWGRRMAARRILKQTAERRSEIARRAAAARWQRRELPQTAAPDIDGPS